MNATSYGWNLQKVKTEGGKGGRDFFANVPFFRGGSGGKSGKWGVRLGYRGAFTNHILFKFSSCTLSALRF